jgi:DNA-binding MarR family transcriptional regulator
MGATPAATTTTVASLCPSVVGDERIVLTGLLLEAAARTSRSLSADLEASCGMPLAWYEVLVRIVRAPEGRLTMSAVASQTVHTSGGTTRLVDRIEEAGYLRRVSCPSDRRTTFVELTDDGAAALEVATAEHLRHIDEHLARRLDAGERTTLVDLLTKLNDGPAACAAAADGDTELP